MKIKVVGVVVVWLLLIVGSIEGDLLEGYRRDTFRMGPWAVEPGERGRWGFELGLPKPVAEEGMGIGFKTFQVAIVDANSGQKYESTEVYLHHALMLAVEPGVDDFIRGNFCDDNDMVWFTASGAEYTRVELPDPYVYEIASDAVLACAWELANKMEHSVDIFIEYEIGWVPLTFPNSAEVKLVTPMFLDVADCREGDFNLPQGSDGVVERLYKTFWAGDIVFAAGHLHTGGYNVSIYDQEPENPTNEDEIFTSVATHHSTGTVITEMTTGTPMWSVDLGTNLRVVARYDTSVERRHVMGIMFLYTHVTEVDEDRAASLTASSDDSQVGWVWAVLGINLAVLLVTMIFGFLAFYMRYGNVFSSAV